MSQTVTIDDLDQAIMKDLKEYAGLATDEMKDAVKSSAATVKKDIQSSAPVRTGAYRKSWAVKKIAESSSTLDLVVHSKNRYQLTHLLEFGHAKRNGGRVPAQPHIASAEKAGKEQLIEDIKHALSK